MKQRISHKTNSRLIHNTADKRMRCTLHTTWPQKIPRTDPKNPVRTPRGDRHADYHSQCRLLTSIMATRTDGMHSVSTTGTGNIRMFTIPASDAELKAWIINGTLYVTGLTPGKPWSVYNLYGQLIYRSRYRRQRRDAMYCVSTRTWHLGWVNAWSSTFF